MTITLPQQSEEAHFRLASLGLSEELLRTAVAKGRTERGEIDGLHPPITPGTVEWSWIMHSLRAQLLKQKWSMSRWRNVDRVVSPNGGFGIFVMRGNAGTGLIDASPVSNSPKKQDCQLIVEHNGEWRPDGSQLRLFGEEVVLLPEPRTRVVDMVHWCLLFHSTESEVRCELSFPISMDTNNFVRGWRERILLNPIHFETNIVVQDIEQSEELDFEATRKEA